MRPGLSGRNFLKILRIISLPRGPSREGLKFGGRSLRGAQPQLFPALERRKGDHARTKNTTKTAAGAAMLFDDGCDPIEDAVRRARGVIATIMEEELDATPA